LCARISGYRSRNPDPTIDPTIDPAIDPTRSVQPMSDHERPTRKTRAAEREDSHVESGADRMPTDEEEQLAELHDVDRKVATSAEEMYERGAKQKGEGRV
jgi:hypothetical protein